jgi:amino-acid N-acetyltransferase
MGIRIALVPGSRRRVDELLRRFGVQWHTHANVRVTPPDAMRYVKLAASDVANRLMAMLSEHDVHAVVGNWVRARGYGVRDGIDYGSTGAVDSVDADVVQHTLDDGMVPIFTSIGWGPRGIPYNISSTQLAVALSRELHAAKLFFLTDAGPLRARDCTPPRCAEMRPDGTVSGLTVEQAQQLLNAPARRTARRQLDFVALALQACSGGVARAHVVDATSEGALLEEIFTNHGVGTMVYSNAHSNIRPLTRGDIPDVLRLMQPSVKAGRLVQRTAEQVQKNAADYVVYEVDGTIHGCAALHRFAGQGEIAALVVDEAYASAGIGSGIVSFFIARAAGLGLRRVFVLTTQSADWFLQAGFRLGRPADLPAARRAGYDRRRRSRVLLYDVPREAQPVRMAAE